MEEGLGGVNFRGSLMGDDGLRRRLELEERDARLPNIRWLGVGG